MNKETFIQFIDKLIEKTKKDQAIWNQSARHSLFVLDFENGRVTIDKVRKERTKPHALHIGAILERESSLEHIELTIYNENGNELAQYTVSLFDDDVFARKLISLYENVKFRYAKEDKVMQNFIKELNDREIVGRREG